MIGTELYPTQYILFVAPSGTGKTNMTRVASDLLKETGLCRAPTSLSRASLIDSLREAERQVVLNFKNTQYLNFNSIYVIANELGVLLPVYDYDFMATLTDMYDGELYEEKKRTKEIHNLITHPQVNMLAGATPSYLNQLMPEGAWEQGFISRVVMVWSDSVQYRDPFAEDTLPEAMRRDLISDLSDISKLVGPMYFTDEAKAAYLTWDRDREPKPTHPRLIGYLTRRPAHLAKLCMVYSVSRSNDMVIELDDFHQALDTLVQVETEMEKIFLALATGGDGQAIDEVFYQIDAIYSRNHKPVPHSTVLTILQGKLPIPSIKTALELMIQRKRLRVIYLQHNAAPFYVPINLEEAGDGANVRNE